MIIKKNKIEKKIKKINHTWLTEETKEGVGKEGEAEVKGRVGRFFF